MKFAALALLVGLSQAAMLQMESEFGGGWAKFGKSKNNNDNEKDDGSDSSSDSGSDSGENLGALWGQAI